ncbi:MAG: hypothetical protein HY815_26100 [Candidatus Riflebacteria bacterium]|nr:hypothetical protein [Candidatus Riflebacteria bacterium]
MRLFVSVALMCLVLFSSVAVHADDGRLSTRDQGRAARFAKLHDSSDQPKEIVSGQLDARPVTFFVSGGFISGHGPYGAISITAFGSTANGRSGDRVVNLLLGGSFVNGQAARGSANLTVFGNTLAGWIGRDNVNVNVYGNVAQGYVGVNRVTLMGVSSTQQAALLLALM